MINWNFVRPISFYSNVILQSYQLQTIVLRTYFITFRNFNQNFLYYVFLKYFFVEKIYFFGVIVFWNHISSDIFSFSYKSNAKIYCNDSEYKV